MSRLSCAVREGSRAESTLHMPDTVPSHRGRRDALRQLMSVNGPSSQHSRVLLARVHCTALKEDVRDATILGLSDTGADVFLADGQVLAAVIVIPTGNKHPTKGRFIRPILFSLFSSFRPSITVEKKLKLQLITFK